MRLYDAFKDNQAVPQWLQQGRNGPGPNYVFEGPWYINQTPRPPRPNDGQTLVPTPITKTNPLPPPPLNSTRSHYHDNNPPPQPLRTSSTQAQSGHIQKNKGKQAARQPQLAQPLELPAIFVTPEPHCGHIPQILKDQAQANKAEKEHHTCQECDNSPSWGDPPDNWDFDHYDHWD